jgi:hypothetical protein
MRFRDGSSAFAACRPFMVGRQRVSRMAAIVDWCADAQRPHRPINYNVNYLRTAGPKDCGARRVVKLGKRIATSASPPGRMIRSGPASGYGSFLV